MRNGVTLQDTLRYLVRRLTYCGVLIALLMGPSSFAQMPPPGAPEGQQGMPPGMPPGGDPGGGQGPPPGDSTKAAESKTSKPEEEDFSGTPFTQYGEFNEASDEEDDAKFFQFGRFFGVSLGLGFQFLDGNRGALWEGGFPVVDFKLHYWFNFNVAVDLGFRTAQHFFDTTVLQQFHVDINMLWVGVDIKYYFDTRNLSAPISFASPYLMIGTGAYTKTQVSNNQQTQDQDSSLGVCAGAGLEFTITPRKVYLELEGKINIVTFKDTYTTIYQTAGIQNLTGNFYSATASVLFTW